jgi:hypothetical protein
MTDLELAIGHHFPVFALVATMGMEFAVAPPGVGGDPPRPIRPSRRPWIP